MLKSKIESIGVHKPQQKISTKDLVGQMEFPPQFDIEAITGIKNRLWKQGHEDSYSMAIDAAKHCLKNSKYKAEDLDIIISGSISRFIGQDKNYYEPALSLYIKRELGAEKAIFFDLSNACAGMFSGMYILDAMIKSGAVKNGMVISGEWVTSIAETAVLEVKDALDPQFGSLTVGDSGAAIIMDKAIDDKDYIDYIELLSTAEYSELAIGKPSNISNKMAMYASNTEMHTTDRLSIWPNFQLDHFEKMGKSFASENFDFIIHHQVGSKFIKKLLKIGTASFNAEMPESLSVLEEYGNTSTTSHFLALYDHLENKSIKEGAKILFVPAGSGFVTGFVSAKISSLAV